MLSFVQYDDDNDDDGDESWRCAAIVGVRKIGDR